MILRGAFGLRVESYPGKRAPVWCDTCTHGANVIAYLYKQAGMELFFIKGV
jgi:hypothetical protein